jgi:hypothetical protein
MNPPNIKTLIKISLWTPEISRVVFFAALALTLNCGLGTTRADETCSSPYRARIEGQE